MRKLLITLLLFSTCAFSQTQDNRIDQQTFPFRIAQQTPGSCTVYEFYVNSTDGRVYMCWQQNSWANLVRIGFPRGTTSALPAVCNAGDPFVATNALNTAQLYVCGSTNNWIQQTGGASGSSLFLASLSTYAAATPMLTCGTGAGATPPSGANCVITGNDLSGTISIIVAATPVSGGTIATITFGASHTVAPSNCQLQLMGVATNVPPTVPFVGLPAPATTTSWYFASNQALNATSNYLWSYGCSST